MRKNIFAKYLVVGLLSSCLLVGCGSSVQVGSKLYQNGELWGTVVDTSDSHTFENGAVEPGVKVDYGPRMGNPPVPPQWLPLRSAERMDVK